MHRSTHKTPEDFAAMIEGGRFLGQIKDAIFDAVAPGVSALAIEELATAEIAKVGGKPSFKMVPGYFWSTCVNINEGVVHGIPKKEIVFREGDVVSVDVGIFYKGFHTDSALTKYLGKEQGIVDFLKTGQDALASAIQVAVAGNRIGDISEALEDTITAGGYRTIRSLTGHGVGRNLHEDPRIPCFVSNSPDESVRIKVGQALAIEIMYTQGSDHLVLENDGWTIRTKDGKIAALFEETVAITENGQLVLTKSRETVLRG